MYWETDNTADKGFEGFNLNELYQVYQGNSEKVYIKRIKAKEYWDEIIKSAHGVAEPGLMFWDNMIDYSLMAYILIIKQLQPTLVPRLGCNLMMLVD